MLAGSDLVRPNVIRGSLSADLDLFGGPSA